MLVGSGILYCWLVVVGMAGCDNGPLLGPFVYTRRILHKPFVYTPRILHKHSCVLTVILYEFV